MTDAPAPPGPGRKLKELLPPSLRVAFRALRSWRDGEPELHLLPQLCSRQLWSIDIGANNGVYSWHMARWSAGVIAFEPQPVHAGFLTRAFGRRVRVEPVALSDTAGEAQLRVPFARHQDGRATIEPQNPLSRDEVREYTVPRRRLDDYDLPGVGLIKIDVEGHELAVLKGARGILERDRPHLIIEAEERHRPDALRSICDFLAPYGYEHFAFQGGRLCSLAGGTGSADHRLTAPDAFNFVFLPRQDVSRQHGAA